MWGRGTWPPASKLGRTVFYVSPAVFVQRHDEEIPFSQSEKQRRTLSTRALTLLTGQWRIEPVVCRDARACSKG